MSTTSVSGPKRIYHQPVMLREVLEEIAVVPSEGWIVDGTFGDGGHSKEIYEKRIEQYKKNKLLSIDWDFSGYEAFMTYPGPKPTLLEKATDQDTWILVKDNFAHLKSLAKEVQEKAGKPFVLAGLLLDLGISSRQYVQKHRGFSFSGEGKADMRMNPEMYAIAAYDLLNVLGYRKLTQLFEENVGMNHMLAAKLAHELVEEKTRKAFGNRDDVERLNAIAYKTMPIRPGSQGKIHPATLLFLALRIAVNTELQNLRDILPEALALSTKGTKLLLMSYHSNEEELIAEFAAKNKLRAEVLLPSRTEITKNPRSRSCKLTIITV